MYYLHASCLPGFLAPLVLVMKMMKMFLALHAVADRPRHVCVQALAWHTLHVRLYAVYYLVETKTVLVVHLLRMMKKMLLLPMILDILAQSVQSSPGLTCSRTQQPWRTQDPGSHPPGLLSHSILLLQVKEALISPN